MSSLDSVNRQWLLAERPTGAPTLDTLRLSEAEVPTPGAGQMLLHTEFLSLDPYMRGRMGDAPSYAPPVPLGGVMVGGTVARVVTSEVAGFAPGDWVLCLSGWQDYAVSDGRGVTNLGRSPEHPSWALGILGMATALPEGPDRMSWLIGSAPPEADPHAGLHHLRRLRRSLRGVRGGHGWLARGRSDEIS
jgi:NADPH-dependent curcumin reductase CurA